MTGQKIKIKDKEFIIKEFIGKGKSAYSYLIEHEYEKYVLKKMHDEPCAYYTFGDKLQSELGAYNKLKEIGIRIPALFVANAEEQYLIKEYIEGQTVAEMVADNKLTDKHFKQIFNMCGKLYSHGINIDYFPTNFVVSNDELVYVDYEFNQYSDEWNFENWGIYYWVNIQGMNEFVETGNHLAINQDDNSGKPIKEQFKDSVFALINRFKV